MSKKKHSYVFFYPMLCFHTLTISIYIYKKSRSICKEVARSRFYSNPEFGSARDFSLTSQFV